MDDSNPGTKETLAFLNLEHENAFGKLEIPQHSNILHHMDRGWPL